MQEEMVYMQVYCGSKKRDLGEAIAYCTDERIDSGEMCHQTLIDFRNACERLTRERDEARAELRVEMEHARIQRELADDERGRRVAEEASHSRTSKLLGEKLAYAIESRNAMESSVAKAVEAARWLYRNAACDCEHLHHDKRNYHKSTTCPVEASILERWPWLEDEA